MYCTQLLESRVLKVRVKLSHAYKGGKGGSDRHYSFNFINN